MTPGTLIATAPGAESLASDQAATLAEFARACKSAARAVSLYPRTHPSIRASLDRLTIATTRLVAGSHLSIVVHPDTLVLDGRSPGRPDPAIVELAALLHERLVGELTIEREADADDWHALLLLLATSPEDLLAAGGFAKALAATDRHHLTIREIDYAEVLRERGGRRTAEWDHILDCCLNPSKLGLDERAMAALFDALGDSEQLAELIAHVQSASPEGGLTMGARAAALLQMLSSAMDTTRAQGDDPAQVLDKAAQGLAGLTPDMVLALVKERKSPERGDIASGLLERATDRSVAEFVARSVEAERGATERLAQALEALVPDGDDKAGVLALAEEVARHASGNDAGFETLWQSAREMLLSYSDTNYVSTEYARELSSARQQAIEVERISDDPPERIAAWVASVSEESIRLMDLALLCDLLRIESDSAKWATIVNVAVPEIERHALLGNFDGARQLGELIAAERSHTGRWDFASEAGKALDRLAAGPFVRNLVVHLRKVDDADVARLGQLCHVVGPALVRPLAEMLAVEENSRCIRRLREILIGFGSAGRQSVEQLKSSSNPAVRRAAIDLLRVFGGIEALPELASMLDDSDPQVQHESIRAIVQIATPPAYAVLETAIGAGGVRCERMLRELIELRDDRTIPVLCFALEHTRARGKLAPLHHSIVEALGMLSPHAESIRALRRVLYAGDWWAPFRTSALRNAAARALRRTGSEEAGQILQEASEKGSAGIRGAARAAAAGSARRERERA